MAKNVNKKNIGITLGVLIITAGLCILCSTYYNTKKMEVFDEMNEEYYNQIVSLEQNVEEINPEPVTTVANETTTTTTTQPAFDYTPYYIGYLSIPNIDFKRGFTAIDSRYNNVNRNLYVLPESNYPDVVNGNFIIAGHSGSSSVSFFRNLYKLSIGNDIYVTYNSHEYHYVIKNIYTDIKDGDITIKRNKKVSTLTLITCTKGDNTTQTIYICELV